MFCAAEPKKDLPLIQRNVRWFEKTQHKEGKQTGAWSYPGGGGDNSNTRFVVLALDKAQQAGVKADKAVWQRNIDHWLRTQNADGSWGYQPGSVGTGSMTSAGIASVTIASRHLQPEKADAAAHDKSIQQGLAWLKRNYTVLHNPGDPSWQFYYLHALQRAAQLTNQNRLGDHDWHKEGTEHLMIHQDRVDGFWRGRTVGEDDPQVATSFALLFLSTHPLPDAKVPPEKKIEPQVSADCKPILSNPRLSRVKRQLAEVARSSIRLISQPVARPLALGRTKFGGWPDLPKGMAWPMMKLAIPEGASEKDRRRRFDENLLPADGTVHLPFIAQINLSETRPFDHDGLLPTSGILYFFYDEGTYIIPGKKDGVPADLRTKFPVAGDSATSGNWKVIYVRDTSSLARRKFPPSIPKKLRYTSHAVSYRNECTLPPTWTVYLGAPDRLKGAIELNKDEWDVYRKQRYDLRTKFDLHQMLGHADQYAKESDESSYRQWRSRLFPKLPAWSELEISAKAKELVGIRLLLQLEVFDDGAEWYGRNGYLFFFIRQSDLKQRRFDKVWATVE